MTQACFLAEFTSPKIGDVIEFSGTEAHHAAAVRRITLGEEIICSNGQGLAIIGPATSVTKKLVKVLVTEIRENLPLKPRIIVAQALAKADRDLLALSMLTELGVTEFIPWQAQRCEVKWTAERREKGLAKWQAAGLAAMKQSRRSILPTIHSWQDSKDLAKTIEGIPTLVLSETAKANLIDFEIRQKLTGLSQILLIVGPEGGITQLELDSFIKAGALPVKISDGVLRSSTAATVAVSQILALLKGN